VVIMQHPYFEPGGKIPLDNLIALVYPSANRLLVIADRDYDGPPCPVEIVRVKAQRRKSFFRRVSEQALVHVRVLRLLLRLRRDTDLIFFLGTTFPIPLVFAKAMRMRCIILVMFIGTASASWQLGDALIVRLTNALERISYHFTDKLIVYSPSIIEKAKLDAYRGKIIVTHRHFLDFDLFRFTNDIEQRDNVIGYVGRLSPEKGVLNFLAAIPSIVSAHKDVKFLIIGIGRLEAQVREYVEQHRLQSKVKLAGWISHDQLPTYLTSMKLLVLPSYAEGLPNVMLEAMACGTPVVATSVASIPDVLTDGENGFLMRDNSPTCIAEAVGGALTCPSLKEITVNARTLVENEFRYEKLVDVWGDIVCNAK